MLYVKHKKGFTLLELIITVAVLTVIMGAVIAFAVRMSNAASDQRRTQALHLIEEQARAALLSIVRDARLCSDAVFSGGVLTLNSTLYNGAEEIPVTVTYRLGSVESTDIYAMGWMLERTIRRTGTTTDIPVGYGSNEWPNPFSPATLRGFNVEVTNDPQRAKIELLAWIPILDNEVYNTSDNVHTADNPFRAWTIESAVTIERRLP